MNDPPFSVNGLVGGKYEIVRFIGRGGMGSVWEGRHSTLGTRVAIKFIDSEYAESQEARSRFVVEARAAATIQSKYAIQIFDHGLTDDGRPYMVMELLVGEPLDKRIERLGSLPVQEVARILGHVCRALQRAHDAGIIHRDLKPENVFLVRSPDDDDEIAKVLDFGIAKIKPPPGGGGLTSSTKTGAVLGTPYYMSPEQARGFRDIDHRTDLWSLGVIAYKCVTGVLPFDGESVGDLLVKICTSPLPVPSATVPGLPTTFDTWFARALERDVPRRFASATELADALSFAAGLSGRAGAASARAALGMHATPPQSSTAASLPAAGVTSTPFTGPAAPYRPKSSRATVLAVVAAALLGGSIGIVAVAKLKSTPKQAGASTTAALSAAAVGAPRQPAASGSASANAAPTSVPTAIATATAAAPATSTSAPRTTANPSSIPTPTHVARPVLPPLKPPPSLSVKPAKPSATAADPGY